MSRQLAKIRAVHAGTGVWDFTCEQHEGDPYATRGISSPKHAFDVMQKHIDKEHPGIRFRMRVISDVSGVREKLYTGKMPCPVEVVDDTGPMVTKTGKVLTEADIEALADEAERGYNIVSE